MSISIYSHRLRKGRYSSEGQAYLITTVTSGRAAVFGSFALGRLLVGELRAAHEQGLVHSMAWVVMPDHLHWLLQLRSGSLPRLIQQVKSKSAIAVNRARACGDRVWQDGYHDRAIRTEKDLIGVARYIVANPVRAGLVKSVRDYSLWDAVWV